MLSQQIEAANRIYVLTNSGAMEEMDNILSALLERVHLLKEPEDYPTLSSDIAHTLHLPLNDVLELSRELADNGWVVISPLNEPPLLYLTFTGLARARRLSKQS
ncbi:hypothetical protein [Rufibacter roseus]|uniref:Uncharacterized protein n=1 Tax=Rufibacter roseus TaxID=1567108 RepID=A0ABW2DNV0_9BACT|nr:hypothetical protein [Rufibacter roseus]